LRAISPSRGESLHPQLTYQKKLIRKTYEGCLTKEFFPLQEESRLQVAR
jgi:hypothetical protein